MTPAILFEPDGYLLSGRWLMGRQSAGNGFLRAAVKGRGDEAVTGYSPFSASAEVFRATVAELDPLARTAWIPGHRQDLLAKSGLLYRPDAVLGPMARQRLRTGPAAYSLCGVTHTLASDSALEHIGRLTTDPLMPWDALICTSNAALSVVTTVLEHEAEYLRWRTGGEFATPRPMLPVIPLGVHTEDFAFGEADRTAARGALGVDPESVIVLCAGRLSIGGKAHPYAMFKALQQVAEDTGKDLVLLFAGQAFNPTIIEVYQQSAAALAPRVRTVFVDGKDAAGYSRAWAASDIFISLSDSIQETFGLTPLEAMASGLPALVSDWNGYKDTVREGIDGFRIPTWAPEPGGGQAIVQRYETGQSIYDVYLYEAAMAVAVDNDQLIARLADLVGDSELRRRMGEAGRAHVRTEFEWSSVYERYRALWAEQTRLRELALADPQTTARLGAAPKAASSHRSPFDTFAAFPTRHVTARTLVTLRSDLDQDSYRELVAMQLLQRMHVAPAVFETMRLALATEARSVEDLSRTTGFAQSAVIEAVARLAKIGLVALG